MSGYTQTELDDVQAKWDLRFPPDLIALYRERRTVIPDKGFDWISASDEIIADALRWPFEGFLFDAHRNGFWWSEWGSRPEGEEDLEAKLRFIFSSTPKLIPVFGHRYLPEEPYESGNPIFSVYQMDVIHYGANLEDYVARETGVGPIVEEWTGLKHVPFWTRATEFNNGVP